MMVSLRAVAVAAVLATAAAPCLLIVPDVSLSGGDGVEVAVDVHAIGLEVGVEADDAFVVGDADGEGSAVVAVEECGDGLDDVVAGELEFSCLRVVSDAGLLNSTSNDSSPAVRSATVGPDQVGRPDWPGNRDLSR